MENKNFKNPQTLGLIKRLSLIAIGIDLLLILSKQTQLVKNTRTLCKN